MYIKTVCHEDCLTAAVPRMVKSLRETLEQIDNGQILLPWRGTPENRPLSLAAQRHRDKEIANRSQPRVVYRSVESVDRRYSIQ